MSSSVFPEPAGACTMKEPRGSRARSRCAASGVMRTSSMVLLRDAAERMLVALLTRGRALRIDAGFAVRELAAQRIQPFAPAGDHGPPVAVVVRVAPFP